MKSFLEAELTSAPSSTSSRAASTRPKSLARPSGWKPSCAHALASPGIRVEQRAQPIRAPDRRSLEDIELRLAGQELVNAGPISSIDGLQQVAHADLRSDCACCSRRRIRGFASFTISSR